jgi:hypothetical protein
MYVRGRGIDYLRVNRALAKTLLALSYPLRYTAHLTQDSRRRP